MLSWPDPSSWERLTSIADQAVVLPLVTGVALVLAVQRHWRLFLAWTSVVSATLCAVFVAKVGVNACAAHIPVEWRLLSPSGHTASAAIVVGGLVLITARRQGRPTYLASALAAAILIGLSRLALGVHSVADVLAGAGLGIAGTVVLACVRPREAGTARNSIVVLGCAAVVVTVFYGFRLDFEASIRALSPIVMPWLVCG